MTVNIFAFADTWNAGATTFFSDKVDVSNGSGGAPVAAAASRVRANYKNGAETWSVDVNGCEYQPQPNSAIKELWNVTPFDANPPFRANVKSYLWPGDARYNQVLRFGWNYSEENRTAGEPSVGIAFENHYYVQAEGKAFSEGYFEYISANGAVVLRPFAFRIDKATNLINAGVQFDTFTFTNNSGVDVAGYTSSSGFFYLGTGAFPVLQSMRNTSAATSGGWRFYLPGSGAGSRDGDMEIAREDGNPCLGFKATSGLINAQYGFGVGGTAVASTSSNIVSAGGTTAKSSLRILSGVAPTSPVNGDIWFDGTDIKMRIGGATKTFTLI